MPVKLHSQPLSNSYLPVNFTRNCNWEICRCSLSVLISPDFHKPEYWVHRSICLALHMDFTPCAIILYKPLVPRIRRLQLYRYLIRGVHCSHVCTFTSSFCDYSFTSWNSSLYCMETPMPNKNSSSTSKCPYSSSTRCQNCTNACTCTWNILSLLAAVFSHPTICTLGNGRKGAILISCLGAIQRNGFDEQLIFESHRLRMERQRPSARFYESLAQATR